MPTEIMTPEFIAIISTGATIVVVIIGLVGWLIHEVHRLEDKTGKQFEAVRAEISNLSGRVYELSGRVDGLSVRVDELSVRVDRMSNRVDGLSNRVSKVEGSLEILRDQITPRMAVAEEPEQYGQD